MKQRDRQIVTLIIWVIFLFMVIMMTERILMVQPDLMGVWPQPSDYSSAQTAQEMQQIAQNALEASKSIMPQVQQEIQNQLAMRMPVAILLVIMMTAAATISTYFVWRNAGLEASLAYQLVNTEKAKRRNRIEQFMDELAPDELVELRTRLTAEDDDEARSLGDLMSNQRSDN